MPRNLNRLPTIRPLLDTSILVAHLRQREGALDVLEWAGSLAPPYVSSITVLEVVQGMHPDEATTTRRLLESLEALPLTSDLAWRAGELVYVLRRQGTTIGLPDAAIATSALSVDAPIVTLNARQFEPVPGLDVIDAATLVH